MSEREYLVNLDFVCECGRAHHIQVGREDFTKAVDRRLFERAAYVPKRPVNVIGGPVTVTPRGIS
jgi:hypothetical protein